LDSRDNWVTTCGDLYIRLRQAFDVTLIGNGAPGAADFHINPSNATAVEGGEIFYIASAQLQGNEI
jgi:voltage-gated potassium channel